MINKKEIEYGIELWHKRKKKMTYLKLENLGDEFYRNFLEINEIDTPLSCIEIDEALSKKLYSHLKIKLDLEKFDCFFSENINDDFKMRKVRKKVRTYKMVAKKWKYTRGLFNSFRYQ